MRNRLVWLTAALLIGFMGFSPSHAQEIENIMINGGFENGFGPTRVWGGTTTGEVVQQLEGAAVPEGPVEGNYCLHVVVPIVGTNSWSSGLEQKGHIFKAGKKYTLSAFLKCKKGTLQIRLKPERGEDPWDGYGADVFTITEEWAEYSVTTPVLTEDVTPAVIQFHIGFEVGDFWVDAVRFYEGDYVPPVFPRFTSAEPSPEDGAVDVRQDVVFSWMQGDSADTHDVYFGTVFDDVNDANKDYDPNGVLVSQNQNEITYDPPGLLEFGQRYYWRVDEVDAPPDYTIFKGDVWSFTAEPVLYQLQNVTATASSSYVDKGPENTVNGSGLDDSGLLHSKIGDGNIWVSGMMGPQPTWIEYEFKKPHKLYEMWIWNANEVFEPAVGIGFKDVTIEYSVNGIDYTSLGATAEFAQAPGADDYPHNTTIDFRGVTAKYVRLTANSNWGGMLDQYGLSEVRFFYKHLRAREPSPDLGATDVAPDAILGWRAGREAAEHDVYLSTDEQAVIDGTAPVETVTETSYGLSDLDLGTTYYWKINEVNMAQTPTTWQGDLWSFTTSDHLVVDDFESYNDLDTTDPESNRIFLTWLDGYDVPTNGSLVGYDSVPFCERTIVHNGKQAMPFFFDNTSTANYSEAECTFAVAQNWTQAGTSTLVLYFYGTDGNTGGQLYVKVNGSKLDYDGDAADIEQEQWNRWDIDLAVLGVNLQSVTTLSIGIDGNGASGKLYFDDIWLSLPAIEPQAN